MQGIGGASLMPVGRYVLVRSIDKREYVRAMSTVATFGLLGSVLGPLLGGALVEFTSWRLIFLINVPVGARRAVAEPARHARLPAGQRQSLRHRRLPAVRGGLGAAADRRRNRPARKPHRWGWIVRLRALVARDARRRLCLAQPAHRAPGGRPHPAARAQRLGRAERQPVHPARRVRHVPAAGAVPAGRLRLVADHGRPDDGAAGAGLDRCQVADRPPARPSRLPPPAARQHLDRGLLLASFCAARPRHAGVADRLAGVRLRRLHGHCSTPR